MWLRLKRNRNYVMTSDSSVIQVGVCALCKSNKASLLICLIYSEINEYIVNKTPTVQVLEKAIKVL